MARAGRRFQGFGVCSALVLLAWLGGALPAAAQPLIRLTAGQGALAFGPQSPRGEFIALGAPGNRDPRVLLGLSLQPIDRPQAICCQRAAVPPGVRCESERGVPLGALDFDVINRYGPPNWRSGSRLGYPGIRFALAGSPPRVEEICVVRR